MKPKLILFDFGGVVIDYEITPDLNNVASTLAVNSEHFKETFFDLLGQSGYGAIKESEIFEKLSETFEIDKDLIEKTMKESYRGHIAPRRKILEYLEKLSKKITIACLTNTIELHVSQNEELGLMDSFDKVFASNRIGYRKPRIEAFQVVLDHYTDIKPEEVIFLDDREDYFGGAIELGMKTIHVPTEEVLIEELDKIISEL